MGFMNDPSTIHLDMPNQVKASITALIKFTKKKKLNNSLDTTCI